MLILTQGEYAHYEAMDYTPMIFNGNTKSRKDQIAPLYEPIYVSVVAVCSPKFTLANYLGYFNQRTMKGSTVLKLPRRAVPVAGHLCSEINLPVTSHP